MMVGGTNRGRGLGRGNLTRVKNRKGEYLWRGDYVDAYGTRRRVMLSRDKRISEQRLKELIKKRDETVDGVRPYLDVNLVGIQVRYLEAVTLHRKPGYVEKLKMTLPRVIMMLGAVTAHDLNGERVTAYQLKRKAEGRANATVNRELSALRGMLTWARRQGIIGVNPLAGFPRLPEGDDEVVKPRRAFAEDEMLAFLQASLAIDLENAAYHTAEKTIAGGTKGRTYAERDRQRSVPQTPLFQSMLLTGMRLGEAMTLTWRDIDSQERLMTLRAVNTKSRRKRIIPIHDDVMCDLEILSKLHEQILGREVRGGDLVFLGPNGRGALDHANCSRLFARIIKKGGIAKNLDGASVTIHSLRHTFCTMLAKAGVPLIEAQKLMGHSDPKLTAKIYSHVTAEDLRPAIDRLRLGGDETKEAPAGYAPRAILEWLRRTLAA